MLKLFGTTRGMAAALSMALLTHLGAASAGAQVLWIAGDATDTIYEVTLEGELISSFPQVKGATSGLAIDVDPEDGSLWGTDEAPPRVVHFTKTGELIDTFPAEFYGGVSPEGVGVAADGTLWLVDDPAIGLGESMVFNISKHGLLIGSFPTAVFDPASTSPQSIAVDPFDGTLWIADNNSSTIYNITTTGLLIDALPSGLFHGGSNLQGISVDRFDGSLWVTARDTSTIYNISRSGELLSSFPSTSYDPNSFNPTAIAYDGPIHHPSEGIQVLDEFEVVSFSNQDGTHDFSTDWIEDDAAGAGPERGNVRIAYGALSLDDYPDTGTQPSASREVDLSDVKDVVLRFDYSTTRGVDENDAVTVEISDDGGASYTRLEVFTGIQGATRGSRRYDISRFASDRTRVRFRVSSLYGGWRERFRVDFLEIASPAEPVLAPSDTDGGDGGPGDEEPTSDDPERDLRYELFLAFLRWLFGQG